MLTRNLKKMSKLESYVFQNTRLVQITVLSSSFLKKLKAFYIIPLNLIFSSVWFFHFMLL